MSLENIALVDLGAQILGCSSSSDQDLFPPENVLTEKEDQIWNSAQGLPQWLEISLQNISVSYSHIAKIGFHCWHDYTTNPKVIEVEVTTSKNQPLVHWTRLVLKLQSGKQFFTITQLPAAFKIIRFTILQAHGDDETYLNQIFMFAHTVDPSQLSLADLNSSRQHRSPLINSNQPYQQQEQRSEEDKYESEQQGGGSLQNDVALLTLSKNVMQMEQNLEDIKRALEVLNIRIDVTYQKLEQRLSSRLEGIVTSIIEPRLERLKQELRSQFRRDNHIGDSRNGKLKMKELRSAEYLASPAEIQSSDSASEELRLKNLKSNRVQDRGNREDLVNGLMQKLAKKLKQREQKVKKMESRREKPGRLH